MYTLAITGIAALAGYIVAVLLSLGITLGVASAWPKAVIDHSRIRPQFKLLHEASWFVCVAAGGYVSARVGAFGGSDVEEKLLLAVALLAVLWLNTWEARQRGMAHQLLISALTLAGIFVGFSLH